LINVYTGGGLIFTGQDNAQPQDPKTPLKNAAGERRSASGIAGADRADAGAGPVAELEGEKLRLFGRRAREHRARSTNDKISVITFDQSSGGSFRWRRRTTFLTLMALAALRPGRHQNLSGAERRVSGN
jgi:hypothetical protein